MELNMELWKILKLNMNFFDTKFVYQNFLYPFIKCGRNLLLYFLIVFLFNIEPGLHII